MVGVACAVGAAEFAVAPGESIEAAVARARAEKGPNTVVLAAGDWYLERTLALDGRDAGLTIRGAGVGRTTLWGGCRLAGWQPDGATFWCADAPGTREGTWDFRVLIVNGASAPRACFPGGGKRLENLGDWKLPLLPASAGYWPRKPTHAELTEMPYKPGDLPATLDFRNAEFRLYHMWAESLSGVASHDAARHVVRLAHPASWPMGACGRRQYEVYNVREGLTEPGQWYLDRTRGKVVYWPKPGEDMEKASVVAPCVETVVSVVGAQKEFVKGVVLCDLTVQCTTVPARRAGFGGGGLPAAIRVDRAEDCAVARVEVCNVGGMGVQIGGARNRLLQSDIHLTGARGVGVGGDDNLVESNRICHVGLMFPSSSAMGAGGRRGVVRRNEIFDAPYSGIIGGGEEMLFEENHIHHVMRTLHDGAAIYGNMYRSTMRGNVVHDIVPNGKGFGASAFYYDEGATDCVIERNYTSGVPRPIHEHMTRHTQVRDNVFVTDGDMAISFQNSIACTFERNTLVLGGKLSYSMPEAIATFAGNHVFRRGADEAVRTRIDDGAPVRTPCPQVPLANAARVATPPVLDGQFAADEWPGGLQNVNRDRQGYAMGGSLSYFHPSWDGTNLYVGVMVTNSRRTELTTGGTWGQDDGVQLEINGRVWRGFVGGQTTWLGEDPAPRAYAGRKKDAKRWDFSQMCIFEVALPFAQLGVAPAVGARIPFNVRVHTAQHNEDRAWVRDGATAVLVLK